MLAKFGMAAALTALATTLALAGDPEGRYRVTGNNPGGGTQYSGTVTVERTGETFRVTWDIGNQTFVGTGIGSEKGLAVAYRSGGQTGIAIYGPRGEGWEGVWAFTDGRNIGSETWTRQ
jgi:hypothetical protein